MTVKLPLVKNSPQNSLIKANTVHVANSKTHAQTPSFGHASKIMVVGDFADKAFTWLGERSTPFNRGVLGAFAFLTQPWIDLFNKDVDEETRKTSCIRTIAKIAVGTTTGILVRMGCIRLMKEFSKTATDLKKGETLKKWQTKLIPSNLDYLKEFGNIKRLRIQHRNAIGTLVAIGVMMITDPPLSKFLTNYLNKRYNNKNQSSQQKGVDNV